MKIFVQLFATCTTFIKKFNSNTFFGGDRIPHMKASHNKLHIKQIMSLGNTKHKKTIPIINMQQRIAFAQDPRFTKS